MPTNLTAYRVHFKVGNKIVYTSLAGNLCTEQDRLRKVCPEWRKGHIKQVGYPTNNVEAIAWALEQARLGKPVPPEDVE